MPETGRAVLERPVGAGRGQAAQALRGEVVELCLCERHDPSM
jgi:hypothetical protein